MNTGTQEGSVLIAGAALWSPAGRLSAFDVLLEDGRIAAVEPSGTIPASAADRSVAAQGDTLLPGLIDAHVHLYEPGCPVPVEYADRPVDDLFAVTCRQLLASGVTTARVHLLDLTSGPALAKRAEDDAYPAPRLECGGPGLMGGEPALEERDAWGVRDVADARSKVRRIAEAGASWVAIHGLHRFGPGELEAVAAEASALGLRVMAEGSDAASVDIALDLGADSIEYLDQSAEHYPDDLLARASALPSPPFFVPTVSAYYRRRAYHERPDLLDDPQLTRLMPGDLAVPAVRDARSEITELVPGWLAEERFCTLAPKLQQLRDSGLGVVVGSDCGSTGQFQADAIWWELQTWRELGATADEAIAAATTVTAHALRLPDRGTIRPGARADVLLYRGRPDEGDLALERVRTVIKGGVVHVDEGAWMD